MLKKILLTVIMTLVFTAPVMANQSAIKIYCFDKLFFEVNQNSWVNNSLPILIGYNFNNFSVGYGMLYSDVFTSPGDRIKFEYLYDCWKLSPCIGLAIDHYRRSDQGGITLEIKGQYKINQWMQLQIGATKGWLFNWSPYLSLHMEVF